MINHQRILDISRFKKCAQNNEIAHHIQYLTNMYHNYSGYIGNLPFCNQIAYHIDVLNQAYQQNNSEIMAIDLLGYTLNLNNQQFLEPAPTGMRLNNFRVENGILNISGGSGIKVGRGAIVNVTGDAEVEATEDGTVKSYSPDAKVSASGKDAVAYAMVAGATVTVKDGAVGYAKASGATVVVNAGGTGYAAAGATVVVNPGGTGYVDAGGVGIANSGTVFATAPRAIAIGINGGTALATVPGAIAINIVNNRITIATIDNTNIVHMHSYIANDNQVAQFKSMLTGSLNSDSLCVTPSKLITSITNIIINANAEDLSNISDNSSINTSAINYSLSSLSTSISPSELRQVMPEGVITKPIPLTTDLNPLAIELPNVNSQPKSNAGINNQFGPQTLVGSLLKAIEDKMSTSGTSSSASASQSSGNAKGVVSSAGVNFKPIAINSDNKISITTQSTLPKNNESIGGQQFDDSFMEESDSKSGSEGDQNNSDEQGGNKDQSDNSKNHDDEHNQEKSKELEALEDGITA